MTRKEARRKALEILKYGIEVVKPANFMKKVKYSNKILKINNTKFNVKGRIFVIGGGKASGEMAAELEKIIGKDIVDGVVNCNKKSLTKKIKIIKAGHPIPNQAGARGVEEMLALKEKHNINSKDLVICLISGGGSALLTNPIDGISLEELQEINDKLLKSGANIAEINTVRKHISKIKGGQLAKHFLPAKVISLILSDVKGDELDVIASGPTTGDKTTVKDAQKILEKYGLKIPNLVETPRSISSTNFILANNLTAIKAIQKKYKLKRSDRYLFGEAAEVAKRNSRLNNTVLGGETTVTISGKCGKGGRNQEYVLGSIPYLRKKKGEWALISAGTDGNDFISGVAGGLIDNESIKEIKDSEVFKHLKKHDSYNALRKIKGIIRLGDTGTNVGDIVVYYTKPL